ncbi:UDP-2,4-diacetamido-2,4,6-trideoxy-beta-L-altropyranose hydrolase [Marinobacter sediminum]|uniref:UDP-2,4-diacetamido-2,4, 6-trideoxy-beta-L-altropyranose hydrolase n=1 Tax=Marinobacter sediminum TaxID=256323 RepID=UPI00193AA141|nr:UDP-2,4-diacetamido-2,4,6-trideoxy-beta-L-altropyranose hydrolase [Marinobacter sediminum]
MHIAFRADASIEIGTGHVMRCLTLADALSTHGHVCVFICRDHQGHLAELIGRRGFEVHRLTQEVQGVWNADDSPPAHADWLGVPWQLDAEQTLRALAGNKVDWMVVDHYALDARWERSIASVVSHILVIDDLADREHQADILLDQNALGEQIKERYRYLVNRQCGLYFGPQYALLGQEYRLLASAMPERDGHVLRVLIFVGGSDPHHLTERYLDALATPLFKHLAVDVVIGNNHPSPEKVSQIVDRRDGARLYLGLPSLSALMVRADLMLGAGGATNWERMCLGLPAIVVSVARNQDSINEELDELSLLHFLGSAENVAVEKIRTCLAPVLRNTQVNSAQSRAMRGVVDGNGTARLVKAMEQISYATP